MSSIRTIALALPLLLLAGSLVCAEITDLNENEIPSLGENDYRLKINSYDRCIVLYYRSDMSDARNNVNLIKVLKNSLPKDVKFFKVDLKKFSKREMNFIAENDIGKKIIPSIIPYKRGFPVQGRIRGPGPLKDTLVNEIVAAYSAEFR